MGNETTTGQLLPFERSAEYLRRVAVRQRKDGRLLPALETLRRSLEKEPDSSDTQLEIARTYAQMRCPGLSNRALFPLLSREEIAAECFHLAGYNFYTMNMDKSARDCFVLYLQKKPAGRFSPDTAELIDTLGEDTVSPLDLKINHRTQRVLHALDSGRPALAIRLARRLIALEKRNSGTHALLAFALLENGDATAAYHAAQSAYRLNSSDVRAICAMAATLASAGHRAAARAFLSRAQKKADGAEDSELICRTACEMGDHARARDVLLVLQPSAPLSNELLHLLAAASYNAGELQRALECWRLLRRIDPADMMAEFRLERAEAGTLETPITYYPDVPRQEVLSRLSHLSAIVQEGVEGIRRRWLEDDTLERLVQWGLHSSQPGIPEAMMGLMTTIRDEDCSAPLVEMLSDVNISDDRKRNALATLCLMGQNGPHYALIGDRISLVHVTRADKAPNGMTTQAEALARHVKSRLGGLREGEEAILLPLCRAALARGARASTMFRLKGVEMAVRGLRGEDAREVSRAPIRRRLIRFARRIMKEAAGRGVHQL